MSQAELTTLIEHYLREYGRGRSWRICSRLKCGLNEMTSGSRGEFGCKLYGDDLETLVKKGGEIEAILNKIRAAADVSVEQVTGQQCPDSIESGATCAAWVPAKVVTDIVESIGGKRFWRP